MCSGWRYQCKQIVIDNLVSLAQHTGTLLVLSERSNRTLGPDAPGGPAQAGSCRRMSDRPIGRCAASDVPACAGANLSLRLDRMRGRPCRIRSDIRRELTSHRRVRTWLSAVASLLTTASAVRTVDTGVRTTSCRCHPGAGPAAHLRGNGFQPPAGAWRRAAERAANCLRRERLPTRRAPDERPGPATGVLPRDSRLTRRPSARGDTVSAAAPATAIGSWQMVRTRPTGSSSR